MRAFKAHDESIIGVKFSADLKMCVTASTGGEIFFFEMDGHKDTQKYDPMCCLKLPDDSKINDFSWNTDDKSLVFGCKNGNVYQIRRPEAKDVDNADSYEWVNPDISTWTIKIMEFQMQKNQKKDPEEEERKRRLRLRGELPPEDEEVEEVWEP